MQAIVLARRDFRENDQLIVLYTLEKGKISTLARGVKKITGKNSAFLEPFFFVEAEIIPGKEINHLTTAVGLNVFKNIRASLDKSLAAGRIVTLLDKCLGESEPDKKIFLLLKNWLEYLDAHDFHRGLLVGFLARFFRLMGLAPVLDRCVVCGKARPAASKKLFFSAPSFLPTTVTKTWVPAIETKTAPSAWRAISPVSSTRR